MSTTNELSKTPRELDQHLNHTPDLKTDHVANGKPEEVSALRWAFRFLRWSTYLAALITLALILHKSTPPPVQASAQAAARAEGKIEQVEEARSQGQAATLRLDESELNSYLANHLDLAKDGAQAAAGE